MVSVCVCIRRAIRNILHSIPSKLSSTTVFFKEGNIATSGVLEIYPRGVIEITMSIRGRDIIKLGSSCFNENFPSLVASVMLNELLNIMLLN